MILCYFISMAHAAQFEFIERIREVFPSHFDGTRILEIGSLDINGSVRQFFKNCDYIGIDVAPGPGVDVVCDGQTYDAEAFDVVVSCEAMEHNPHWAKTLCNMVRLCKSGGLVLMTCATSGRPEHGTSAAQPSDSPLTLSIGWDYYRNLTADDVLSAGIARELGFCQFFTNWQSHDLYMLAMKDGIESSQREQIRAIEKSYRLSNFSTFKGVRNFVRARLAEVRRAK